MTYAIVTVKGIPNKRGPTNSLFESLVVDAEFEKEFGVKIEKCLLTFGWPDFVLILKSNNVELLKHAIVEIRNRASAIGDNIETSTLICIEQDQIKEKRKEWAKQA